MIGHSMARIHLLNYSQNEGRNHKSNSTQFVDVLTTLFILEPNRLEK